MEYATFNELQTHIQALYRQEAYAAALELATEQAPNFPEQFHLLAYWQVCMAVRTEQIELALRVLDELLERGFWYGESLLRKSPSLLPLQGLPEFEARVEHSHELQAEEQARLFPLLTLRSAGRCGAGQDPCSLLVGLHANASTAQASLNFWRAAAVDGWLVAAPQSTQAMWRGAYVWDDRQISEAGLLKHMQGLKAQYAFDPKRVVLGGHSSGGELALWLAIKGIIPCQGFIAIGPGGPLIDDVENWTAILYENPQRSLRGYVIVGQEDESIPQENVRILVDILNETGIPTELEEIPDVGHDFSPEYEDGLRRGLDFIKEEV
jgi:predicted esterase